METIRREIFTQNDALQKTHQELLLCKDELTSFMRQPFRNFIFMGCGSGYMLCCSGASMFSLHTDKKALALAGGEVLLHPEKYIDVFTDSLVITTSRSGETSEVIYSLEKMKELTTFQTLGILAKKNCTMTSMLDVCIEIPWAYDESVCQTRNITNFYYALSMLYSFYAEDTALENSLTDFLKKQPDYLTMIEPACQTIAAQGWTNVTVLADGEVSGIASEGALAFTEICILPGEHFNLLDYRHGPIVVADSQKLVIVLLNPNDAIHQKKILSDLKARGSFVITLGHKTQDFWQSDYHVVLESLHRYETWGLPFINLCQVLAFHKALSCGHDPDVPEGLNPFVKF